MAMQIFLFAFFVVRYVCVLEGKNALNN